MDRNELDRRIAAVTKPGPHLPAHIRFFVDAVLNTRAEGVLVECGTFEGVSAAKFSHLALMLGKRLVVFDSFEGLPANDETHLRTIGGALLPWGQFVQGAFAGSLDQVRDTVSRWGEPEVVDYVPGWFADTLPAFDVPVCAAYLDVDLAASATTCLTHLWPLVTPGGVIVSQDGDFPVTVEAMRTWAANVDPAPTVEGLGTSKMVAFYK